MNIPLVLASGSAARRMILRRAGVPFQLCRVEVDEETLRQRYAANGMTVSQMATALAEAKARAALASLQEGASQTGRALGSCIILGADQILEANGRIYNKPATLGEARQQLAALRGQIQHLRTAMVCLHYEQASTDHGGVTQLWHHVDSPRLHMRSFSDEVLERYLAVEGQELLYCVGACKVEGVGQQLFSSIEGNQDSIMGLPLLPLLEHLRATKALPS
ncbi:Maf family protein [Formicincola oecophyllae]|nr:Maf family protein [Formicincola oecophyllae]